MISVITIVKNDKSGIERTIKSVLSQTYKDIEFVIKDGLSTDGTTEFITKLLRQNPCSYDIKYLNTKDNGIYNAMNQAIRFSTGKWLIFINSGDELCTPDTLSALADLLDDDIDILFGDAIVRDDYGDYLWKADISKIHSRMPFNHQSCLFKASLFDNTFFDETYKIAADYDLIATLYNQGFKFVNAHKIFSIFELNGLSSTKYINALKERYIIREKNNYVKKYYKYTLEYISDYLVSIIKTLVAKLCPPALTGKVRNYYKTKYKKYVPINETFKCH